MFNIFINFQKMLRYSYILLKILEHLLITIAEYNNLYINNLKTGTISGKLLKMFSLKI